jgi:Na+/H+ antiporter NhaD/arsenite permease-like protein
VLLSVIAGAILLLTYLILALGRAPFLRIDRTGAAIVGAILMIATGVRWVAQAVHQPTLLLVSIVFRSGTLSALFVNDTVCLVFTPILIEIADARGHRPLPYLAGNLTLIGGTLL